MKISLLLKFILFLTIMANLSAQEIIHRYQVAADEFNLPLIAKKFEIVERTPQGFEVYVLKEREGEFLKLASTAKILERDINFALREKAIPVYRNFGQVENDLKSYARRYSKLASIENYGKSGQGRNLYALKLSTGGKNKERVLVTGATHGDELITTEMIFIFISELLEAYGKDRRLTEMLEGRDLYFIPVVSPDSFEARERYVRRVDPNRAFPWPGNPDNTNKVDVIEALIKFTGRLKFAGILDLHAYGKLVMYPWSYTQIAPPSSDLARFEELSKFMAHNNQYKTGQISRVLYEAQGSSGDYFYWQQGALSLAAEIGREKIPHWSKFPAIADEVREMIWRFVEYF